MPTLPCTVPSTVTPGGWGTADLFGIRILVRPDGSIVVHPRLAPALRAAQAPHRCADTDCTAFLPGAAPVAQSPEATAKWKEELTKFYRAHNPNAQVLQNCNYAPFTNRGFNAHAKVQF